MTSPLPFAQLLQARRVDAAARTVTFEVPTDWQQGRTTFGGLIASLSVQAMRDVAGGAWDAHVRLRALQTSFIGPVDAGPVEVQVTVLREGKNVRQVQALVRQAGETAALLLGVFGTDRETVLPVRAPAQPSVALDREAAPAVPFMAGIAPNFLQHLDLRWGEGGTPFSGADTWHSRIHLRLRSEAVHPELLTVLLADMPPTPALSRLTRPTPASSVSWELELRPVDTAVTADDWWRVDTEVVAAAGGYVNQVTRLWTPSGDLASLGYQVVTVYA